MSPPFLGSVAIFAHNEASTIASTLDSVLLQDRADLLQIFVLVNGSQDATESIVREYSKSHSNVNLVILDLADKANAWNYYVHTLRPKASVHFFVDGDMVVTPGSFLALNNVLSESSKAHAAGAFPATGRNKESWSARMRRIGRLAGCLYALKGDFVSELREQHMFIPVGFIGEDFFLSCLVKGDFSQRGLIQPNPKLIFSADAGFAFRSLSIFRPWDWFSYAKRLVSYQVREYQLIMLLNYVQVHGQESLPPDVVTLYRQSAELPRYYWRGRMSLFDWLAVRRIRIASKGKQGNQLKQTK